MLSCKDVSRLVSESLDGKLTLWQRMQLRLHLMMCGLCVRFRQQIQFLSETARRYEDFTKETSVGAQDRLPAAARERIKQVLRSENS